MLGASQLQVQETAIGAGNSGRVPSARRPQWSFARAGARERPSIEDFIRRCFERAYRARFTRFMPVLMALRRGGEIAAACGLRAASDERLYLETYLDWPVETTLSAATGETLGRGDIVEVGNLAVAGAGCARRLIIHLTTYLHARGPAWVAFTAVPALRNNFLRLGIPLVTLAPADGTRLGPAARAEWGTYYDQAPQVTAVKVSCAFDAVCEAACTR